MLHAIEPGDEALAERVAQGDLTAYLVLYDRYAQRVYAWAAHLLGPSEAEDVTQEAFLRLWRKAHQFDRRRGTFAAWFMAVSRHEILGAARRRGRRERIGLAAAEIDDVFARVVDPSASPHDATWSHIRAGALADALATLPAEQRRVIVLAYFAGLSQSTIAATLAVPLGTVKKRVRLGIAKLRAALDGSMRTGTD